jgi:hypothetical protein
MRSKFPTLRLLCVPVLWLAGTAATLAAEQTIPDPLSLGEALAHADESPRVALGERAPFPRRLPLYLDCHRLAYSQLGADESRSGAAEDLLPPLAAQQLEIMERFLDVLLADLSYSRYNEALAAAYVQFDRANVRRELGQYSELKVAELETAYQDVLRKRAASEATQRLTRELLAQAMGRPGQLPRELTLADLPEPPAELPELDAVLPAVLEHARAPAGDAADGAAARRLSEMELRQQTLELLLRLQNLAAVARYAQVESAMRDLKLDESRTLYEQEVKADLGFSMSQQTKSRLQEKQAAYCRALTWAELQALQGQPVWSAAPPTASPARGEGG